MESTLMTGANVALTAIIALLTYKVWRSYKRIEWLTDAMASHSAMQVRIEARRENIPVVWWDKSAGDVPHAAAHAMPAVIDTIYLGLPRDARRRWLPLAHRIFG